MYVVDGVIQRLVSSTRLWQRRDWLPNQILLDRVPYPVDVIWPLATNIFILVGYDAQFNVSFHVWTPQHNSIMTCFVEYFVLILFDIVDVLTPPPPNSHSSHQKRYTRLTKLRIKCTSNCPFAATFSTCYHIVKQDRFFIITWLVDVSCVQFSLVHLPHVVFIVKSVHYSRCKMEKNVHFFLVPVSSVNTVYIPMYMYIIQYNSGNSMFILIQFVLQ